MSGNGLCPGLPSIRFCSTGFGGLPMFRGYQKTLYFAGVCETAASGCRRVTLLMFYPTPHTKPPHLTGSHRMPAHRNNYRSGIITLDTLKKGVRNDLVALGCLVIGCQNQGLSATRRAVGGCIPYRGRRVNRCYHIVINAQGKRKPAISGGLSLFSFLWLPKLYLIPCLNPL